MEFPQHTFLQFIPKSNFLRNDYLTNHVGIDIDTEMKMLFSELMDFQLEGRYPELTLPVPDYNKAMDILKRTKEALLWLQEKLN